jgi:nitroimidazol reductase NimA-like FMN-containing flavoprotein (pyridoxamine 5'-phosphate oxidase superfamily)
MTTRTPAPTPRTTLGRLRERGAHDRETIDAILDEGMVCHVAFVVDGHPLVIPTAYARLDDQLIVHGAASGRMMRTLASGAEVCITVTLLDGLVLARSAFHHSMNYRSVMIFGRGTPIEEPEAKRRALDAIVEHLVPGRTEDARGASDPEMEVTSVVAFSLDEASAKIRTGPPKDSQADMTLDVWAGVIPLRQQPLPGEPDPLMASGQKLPSYVAGYRRPSTSSG